MLPGRASSRVARSAAQVLHTLLRNSSTVGPAGRRRDVWCLLPAGGAGHPTPAAATLLPDPVSTLQPAALGSVLRDSSRSSFPRRSVAGGSARWPRGMASRTGSGSPGLCAEDSGRLEVEDLTCFLRRAGRHLDGWAGSLVKARIGVCLEWLQVWRVIAETTDRSVGNTTHFSREDIFSERQSNGIK